jgi:hypothetical protein
MTNRVDYLTQQQKVVPRLHLHCHDHLSFPGLHNCLKVTPAERQTAALHLLLHRHRLVLLHFRSRRVNDPFLYTHPPFFLLRGGITLFLSVINHF